MRWIILALILCLTGVGLWGFLFLKGYPHEQYSKWIHGGGWNKYYEIPNYKKTWLAPVMVDPIPGYKEDYAQLWKEFPIRNSRIPLPVRHPLFQTIPLIESRGKKRNPQIGIILQGSDKRELSRIYTLPMSLLKDHNQGQELFKLPFVRNRILKFSSEQVWKDIFSYKIEATPKKVEEMIYDLYILHLRSKVLPKETVKYSLTKDEKVVIELSSIDKDYMMELVMTNKSGNIYSYILRTELNNIESRKLRSKFIESISFSPVDSDLGKFLYTEFKHLNFARQVDQEGMLYLYSAWTQDTDNLEMFREMIFYLEKGRNNNSHLRPLYGFAMKHFGKTFTTNKIFNEHEDPEISLQRKIEIENIEKAQKASEDKTKTAPVPELTPDEKMNIYLKKAKEEGPSEQKDMTIH